MGKGGAGKQHVQATPEKISELLARFEDQRRTTTPEAELLNKYWWLVTESTLRRFITANNCNIDGAQKQILDHLRWRGPYGVESILEEDFSDMEARRELYWEGFDLEGNPVIVWNVARHDGSEVSPERYTKFFIYLLEVGARDFFGGAEKPGTFVIILNAAGIGPKNLDIAGGKYAGPILENHFPERQRRTYVVHVGRLIRFAWGIACNFLDPGTVYKICLLSGFHEQALLENFSPEQVRAIERGCKEAPVPKGTRNPASKQPAGTGVGGNSIGQNGSEATRSGLDWFYWLRCTVVFIIWGVIMLQFERYAPEPVALSKYSGRWNELILAGSGPEGGGASHSLLWGGLWSSVR